MKFLITTFLTFVLVAAAAAAAAAVDPDPIFSAMKDNDAAAIRTAVENDPSLLEFTGRGGQTPLLKAVLMGSKESVVALLELGANMMSTEGDGYGVLHAAGFQGRPEILELLLARFLEQKESGGNYLDPESDLHQDGFYPMHRACWGRSPDHAKTVEVFLKHGVPADQLSKDGKTCEEMTKNPLTKRLFDDSSEL